jgi:hypothetical protein
MSPERMADIEHELGRALAVDPAAHHAAAATLSRLADINGSGPVAMDGSGPMASGPVASGAMASGAMAPGPRASTPGSLHETMTALHHGAPAGDQPQQRIAAQRSAGQADRWERTLRGQPIDPYDPVDPGSGTGSDGPWHRQVFDERGLPVTAGARGTAARMMSVFKSLDVPQVAPEEFAQAILGWMLPAQGHSLHEVVRGIQLAAPELFDGADLLARIPGLTGQRLAEIIGQWHPIGGGTLVDAASGSAAGGHGGGDGADGYGADRYGADRYDADRGHR